MYVPEPRFICLRRRVKSRYSRYVIQQTTVKDFWVALLAKSKVAFKAAIYVLSRDNQKTRVYNSNFFLNCFNFISYFYFYLAIQCRLSEPPYPGTLFKPNIT